MKAEIDVSLLLQLDACRFRSKVIYKRREWKEGKGTVLVVVVIDELVPALSHRLLVLIIDGVAELDPIIELGVAPSDRERCGWLELLQTCLM